MIAEDHVITTDDLPENVVSLLPHAVGNGLVDPMNLREVEKRHIVSALEQAKGNKVHAAKTLGISRRALYRLIAKYHLEGAPTEA